jgi:hypothetical protein
MFFLFVVACHPPEPPACVAAIEVRGDGVDQDCDGSDLPAAGTWRGDAADEWFGARVLFDAGVLVVGAPFRHADGEPPAGRVAMGRETVLTGAPGDLLGRDLARLDDGTVLVTAPGVGEVRDIGGTVLAAGTGVGGALAARGDRWVTTTLDGARWDDGTEVDLGGRPDALLVLADGRLVAGFARGDTAIRIGDVSLPRPSAQDEAGAVLALWSTGGREVVAVGAPGAGRVYLLDPAAPAWGQPLASGTGRFGGALATAPAELYVGAPMDGTEAQGAVYAVSRDGAVRSLLVGTVPGDQLGTSLATTHDVLAVGSPGDVGTPGTVLVLIP